MTLAVIVSLVVRLCRLDAERNGPQILEVSRWKGLERGWDWELDRSSISLITTEPMPVSSSYSPAGNIYHESSP